MTWLCVVAASMAGILVPVSIRILLHMFECERRLNVLETKVILLEEKNGL